MFEQSSKFQLVQLILDHPSNRDRDAHECNTLSKRLAKKSFSELEEMYDRLPVIGHQKLTADHEFEARSEMECEI